MWVAELAAAAEEVGADIQIRLAIIGSVTTVTGFLLTALVALIRRDGNRTTASPPEPSDGVPPAAGGPTTSPTMRALAQSTEARIGDVNTRVGDLVSRIEDQSRAIDAIRGELATLRSLLETILRHPSQRGPR